MNDKDKEAFEEWADVKTIAFSASAYEAWRNACEYKQKEIDELLKQLKHEHDLYKKHLKVYEDENAKLKSTIMLASEASCYTEYEDACGLAKRVLKLLEQK